MCFRPKPPTCPRCCLLILVMTSMNLAWLIEQPRSSMLPWHPRIRWLFSRLPKVHYLVAHTLQGASLQLNVYCHSAFRINSIPPVCFWRLLAEVFVTTWWMGKYKSKSPKRHIGWGNSPAMQRLDLGQLCKEERLQLKQGAPDVKTTRQYRNRQG